MYNLLIALAIGAAILLGIRFGTAVGWVGAVVPAVIAFLGTYILLARRAMKGLEGIFAAAQKELMAQRFEKAVQVLESGFVWAPWQFLVRAQIHGQIGVLLYVRREFDTALPHLEKSFSRHWLAQSMLAVSRYRQKDLAGMERIFETAVRVSKKEGLVWCVYAWCLEKEGRRDDAVKVLSRGASANPSDEKLKAALATVQNGKKLKLGKQYGEQWFQFHLERMPDMMGAGPRGRRVVFQRR
jgi:tetratricopeptide (TPR) repeat protein